MKIYIVGNEKDIKRISEKISKILSIEIFDIKEKKVTEINEIIRTNKKWIIKSCNESSFDIVASNSTKIIYLKNDIETIKKYSNKIIIIRNKKEEKILLKAVEEGHSFML